MNICEDHEYHYYPQINEDGWRCVRCDGQPGEPPGFSPKLDREMIYIKVGGILMDTCDTNLISVSNGTDADLLTSEVAAKCAREGRYDQYSILLFLLEEITPGHAEYWKGVGDGVMAGRDERDRCGCGKLAKGSTYNSVGWTHYCDVCRPPLFADLFETEEEELAA